MATTEESLHVLDYWRVIRTRKEIIIAVFLLFVITGFVFTLTASKEYEASTIVQVEEETSALTVFGRERWGYDPLFLRTQFEIIQAPPVIEEVIRRSGIGHRIAESLGMASLPEEDTYRIVSRGLRVQHYRDTNLIEIRIRLSLPEGEAHREVAQVADTFARVYRERSLSQTREAIQAALDALQEKLEEQQERVRLAEDRVEAIQLEYGIVMLRRAEGADTASERRSIVRLEDELIMVKRMLADRQTRLDTVRQLEPQALIDAAPYLVENNVALQSLVKAKREAEVRLSELQISAYGEKHPDVIRIQTIIKGLSSKIDDELKGLKTGMEAAYATAKAQYDILERELEERKQGDIKASAGGYRELNAALEELDHAKRIRDAMEMKFIQEQIQMEIPSSSVEIIARAKAQDVDDFVSPKLVLNLLLSIFMGLCAGIGLAYFVEYIDTSIKTIDDVENFMNQPVVGVIPQRVDAFVNRDAYREHAEAYRMLRTNVRFSARAKDARTYCVTSGSMGEGKSLTVFNLGVVCAELGDRVLIVDADMHRPRQHKIVGVGNRSGLANILVGQAQFDDAVVSTEFDNLDLLPSGRLSSGTHGLLDTSKMREFVSDVSKHYDLVIFDAPPIIGVSDASLLAREVDCVLLVIQHRKYPRSVSLRARAMVENTGGNLIGVVLNRINVSRDYSYYYHYNYRYSPSGGGASGSGSAADQQSKT